MNKEWNRFSVGTFKKEVSYSELRKAFCENKISDVKHNLFSLALDDDCANIIDIYMGYEEAQKVAQKEFFFSLESFEGYVHTYYLITFEGVIESYKVDDDGEFDYGIDYDLYDDLDKIIPDDYILELGVRYGFLLPHRYEIVAKETWDHIDTFRSLEEAEKELEKYEKLDKEDGCYEPDFYEILEKDWEIA